MIQRLFLSLLLLTCFLRLSAKVQLPALIGDNMVLQRDQELNIWGWAAVGEKVSVSFLDEVRTTITDASGKWKVRLPALPAGGPHQMTITGENSIVLQQVMLGDVWLASGQSNMEWPLHNINNAEAEIADADYPDIRLFTVARKAAVREMEDVSSTGWQVCTSTTARDFSAVALLFGRELHQKYEVPIGLIHSSWGGTVAEAWMSPESLQPFRGFHPELTALQQTSQEAYDALPAQRRDWYAQAIDRGRSAGADSWASVQLDDSDWPTMSQPSLWYDHEALMRFGGTMWLRKTIHLSNSDLAQALHLSLSNIMNADITYFNGHVIGSNTGYDPVSAYTIPPELAQPGANVIAVRITGQSEFGGIIGDPEELFVQVGKEKRSLEGDWQYQPGPDLSTFPQLPGLPGYSQTMPKTPAVLYHGMLAPLTNYTIKGVIWYQGESNAESREQARQYYELFPALIRDWRQHWGTDFPFLFVQLANFRRDEAEPTDYPWATLRDAQTQTLQLPNTGMATTIDIGNVDDIHPRNKQDVAHRLVLAARKIAYGEALVYSGPAFRQMQREGSKMRIQFSNIGSGLQVKDQYGYLKGFAIAGADGRYFWAQARQEGQDIIVHSARVREPVAVRYNWGNSPDGNLFNLEGLPAVPFQAGL